MKKNNTPEKNICNYKKGFTLIEALVAIFILTVSVTALLGVVSQSVFNSNYAKNKAIAVGLAQEGIELIRNIQDTKLLQNTDPNMSFVVFLGTHFQECVFNEGMCTIDPISLVIQSCPNQVCQPLLLSSSGYYNYSFGNPTSFTRSISVQPTSQNSGLAKVTVSWEQGGVTKSVVYETELFLWIQ